MPTSLKTDVFGCRPCQRGSPFETPRLTPQVMRFTNVKVKKENLSKQYKVSLPASLEKQFLEIAKGSNMALSAVLRKALLESKPVFKAAVPVSLQEERVQAIRLLRKSSNNLNQIARHLNTLALRNELNYAKSIHYLRILDTIEAQQHILVRLFDVN